MVRVIEDLAGDWRRLDERIEGLSSEIEVLARKADKWVDVLGRPLCAISDRTQRSKIRSLDHLVGACQQRGRYLEAERLGCLEIDDKFELDWRFHR
jgi:hypothetical protein